MHLCEEEGFYPEEVVAHPLVELAGLPILSGDHSSILAPGPCPSPEGLTQLHTWTIVPILMDLAAAVTQRERKRSLQGTEGVGEGS